MNKCAFGGKVAYASEQVAKHARNAIGRQSHNMRVYRCPNCYRWHLTNRLD